MNNIYYDFVGEANLQLSHKFLHTVFVSNTIFKNSPLYYTPSLNHLTKKNNKKNRRRLVVVVVVVNMNHNRSMMMRMVVVYCIYLFLPHEYVWRIHHLHLHSHSEVHQRTHAYLFTYKKHTHTHTHAHTHTSIYTYIKLNQAITKPIAIDINLQIEPRYSTTVKIYYVCSCKIQERAFYPRKYPFKQILFPVYDI